MQMFISVRGKITIYGQFSYEMVPNSQGNQLLRGRKWAALKER